METFKDIEIICSCGQHFTWTSGEQAFVYDLLNKGKLDRVDGRTGNPIPGEVKQPKRCKECRLQKKRERFEQGRE